MASGPTRLEGRLAGPGQDRGARDQADHAERDAAVEVLVEYEPRHERRRHAFQREQKGSGGGVGAAEADHEEEGTRDAPRDDRSGKPGQVGPGQGGFPGDSR